MWFSNKTSIVIIAILCVLTLGVGISLAVPVTDINNPHNLSAWGPKFNYMTMQVCVFCHTPHGADTGVHTSTYWNAAGYQNTGGNGSFLLWNRDIQNSTGFLTYTSSTFQGGSGEVRVYSLLCMSCHDGVSAINVMSNLPNKETLYWMGDDPWGCTVGGQTALCPLPSTSDNMSGLPSDLGDRSGTISDLANDHPISFDYDDSITGGDSGLAPLNPAGYVGVPAVKLFPNQDGDLVSVECSTCHDVHNYETNIYWRPFLVMSNQQSGLCLNCHLK